MPEQEGDPIFYTGEEAAQRILDQFPDNPALGKLLATILGMIDSDLLMNGIDPSTMQPIKTENNNGN